MKSFHENEIADFRIGLIKMKCFSKHFHETNLENVKISLQNQVTFICISWFFKIKFGHICFRCNIIAESFFNVFRGVNSPFSPDVRRGLNHFWRFVDILLKWLNKWIDVSLVDIHNYFLTIELMWDSNEVFSSCWCWCTYQLSLNLDDSFRNINQKFMKTRS